MKTTNLTLAIESEKLAALKQYAAKRQVDIDAELRDAVEKLYEKYVPAAVREYLAEREPPAPGRPPRPSRAPSSATGE
ncbi:DUF6103 family protein [Oscillospiraceae bacterium OttesenSCG-928-G22]|nr:DUF6103 family protein [Oscillospiraceae bacterium OttesenSCG-928-G22]